MESQGRRQSDHAIAKHTLSLQAHFDAPSSERRKLMSAPLNSELKQKYSVSKREPWRLRKRSAAVQQCSSAAAQRNGDWMHFKHRPAQNIRTQPNQQQLLRALKCRSFSSSQPHRHQQVKAVPIRRDDEVQVVRGTFKVCAHRQLLACGLR